MRSSDHDRAASALGERVDALAAALIAAGVDPERAARVLGAAAAATLDALALDLLLAGATAPAPAGRAHASATREAPARLAA